MSLPSLDDEGLLPIGVHECTLAEVRDVFGRFRGTDRREVLCSKLERYIGELRRSGIARALYIDGSFVTAKGDPDDIDLIVVSDPEFEMTGEMPPATYNALSNRTVRRMFGFDMAFVPDGSAALEKWLDLFQRVKHQPARRKGIIRIAV